MKRESFAYRMGKLAAAASLQMGVPAAKMPARSPRSPGFMPQLQQPKMGIRMTQPMQPPAPSAPMGAAPQVGVAQ